jgi:hypothetical protein
VVKKAMGHKRTLFQSTVVRMHSDGTFILVDHPKKGWSSFGYPYASINALLDNWDVRLGPHGVDACSVFIEAHNNKTQTDLDSSKTPTVTWNEL